ncbi:MAG: hypothetical protein JW727_04925 [Candidatus Aenigmarchaeota archaeon]|nr:hypothetical protein [Candidatus Aenigmarchaeota archaeon]
MEKGLVIISVLLLVCLIAFSGCTEKPPVENQTQGPEKTPEELYLETLVDACVQECKNAKLLDKDLSNGPCLLDPMPQNKSWVCDVAHVPRIAADARAENQCLSFRQELATHFIEVDPECNYLRKW